MVHMACSAFDEHKRVHLINLLSNQGRIAEFLTRRFPRCIRMHAAFDVFLRRQIQVRLEFLALLGVGGFAVEESPPIHPCFSVAGLRM